MKRIMTSMLAVLLALGYSPSIIAQTKIKAENPEEVELLIIVAHLAKVNGYDWDEKVLIDRLQDGMVELFKRYVSN